MEVKLESLTKIFPGTKKRPDTTAVNEMSFTIPDGKLVGLLGPSGCGKSTTLYMIAGLHKPTGGRIFFGDADVTNVPPENRGIGLVFQNYALYPHLTVKQNIMFPLENVRPRMTKAAMTAVAKEMAELVDIGQYLDRKPKEISGGQQQRVAIARALAKKPQVLLLDEPLSNLDARLRLQTREEIKRIQRETGITTVFVTHDQEEAMSISDEIVVMKFGVIQQMGEPQHVYDEPANMFVAKFLGSPAINLFKGELKNDKLYLNNKIFDSEDYHAKENFDYGSEEAFKILANLGYHGTYENYLSLVYHFEQLVEAQAKAKEAAAHAKANAKKKTLPGSEQAVQSEIVVSTQKGEPIKDDDFIKEIISRLDFLGESKINEKKYRYAVADYKIEHKLNRRVNIGIRPENFMIDPKGKIPVEVSYIEHIGRDITVVGNIANQTSKLRIIIPSALREQVSSDKLAFGPRKFYIFEEDEDGTRIK